MLKITTYTQILVYVRVVEWAAFIFLSPKSVLKVYLDKEADANYGSDGVGVIFSSQRKKAPPAAARAATSQVGSGFLAIRSGQEVPFILLLLQGLTGREQDVVVG